MAAATGPVGDTVGDTAGHAVDKENEVDTLAALHRRHAVSKASAVHKRVASGVGTEQRRPATADIKAKRSAGPPKRKADVDGQVAVVGVGIAARLRAWEGNVSNRGDGV